MYAPKQLLTILLDFLNTGRDYLCQSLKVNFTEASASCTTATSSSSTASATQAILHMLQIHAFVGRHFADVGLS